MLLRDMVSGAVGNELLTQWFSWQPSLPTAPSAHGRWGVRFLPSWSLAALSLVPRVSQKVFGESERRYLNGPLAEMSSQPRRQNPFWAVSGLAVGLKGAFTTAQRAIDRPESGVVVVLVGVAKRNRVYCAGFPNMDFRTYYMLAPHPARLHGRCQVLGRELLRLRPSHSRYQRS